MQTYKDALLGPLTLGEFEIILLGRLNSGSFVTKTFTNYPNSIFYYRDGDSVETDYQHEIGVYTDSRTYGIMEESKDAVQGEIILHGATTGRIICGQGRSTPLSKFIRRIRESPGLMIITDSIPRNLLQYTNSVMREEALRFFEDPSKIVFRGESDAEKYLAIGRLTNEMYEILCPICNLDEQMGFSLQGMVENRSDRRKKQFRPKSKDTSYDRKKDDWRK